MMGETLTWTASGLPPGVRVTAAGVLTGMIVRPPAADSAVGAVTYRATVTATERRRRVIERDFNWQVSPSCAIYLSLGTCQGR